jgi:membrane-associated phospholipid phosphatase
MTLTQAAPLLAVTVLVASTAHARPFEPAGRAPAWQSRLFAGDVAAEETREAEEAPEPPVCSDPTARTQLSRCFPHLFLHDTVLLFTAPKQWKAKEWGLVAAGVVGVASLTAVDDDLRTAVRRSGPGFEDNVASTFQPFGTWASFAVIGGFYFGGLAAHDQKARGVASDAVVASILSGVIITPALKKIFGRSRPRDNQGPYDFHPFGNGPSFPSGHATQAFTVASVIATEYPKPWVQVACYVPATLVLYARMRHDGHWASDVVAGALIGWGVGYQVATFNQPLREGKHPVQVLPFLAPKAYGLVFVVPL